VGKGWADRAIFRGLVPFTALAGPKKAELDRNGR